MGKMVKCVIVYQVYFAMGTRHTGSYYIMAIVTPKELLNVVGDVVMYHVNNVKKIALAGVEIGVLRKKRKLIVMMGISNAVVQEMLAREFTVTRLIVIIPICKLNVHYLTLKPCL